MKFKYTPVNRDPIRDQFIITIEYMHGDADSYTNGTVSLSNEGYVSDDVLIEYIKKFEEIATYILDCNHSGVPLPENLDELCEVVCGGVSYTIPFEHDHHWDGYATMKIEGIKYFDIDGAEFDVTVEK